MAFNPCVSSPLMPPNASWRQRLESHPLRHFDLRCETPSGITRIPILTRESAFVAD